MKNKKQYKVGDRVKYDGEDCIVINVGVEDYDLVIVPMSVIDEEAIGVELNELD